MDALKSAAISIRVDEDPCFELAKFALDFMVFVVGNLVE